MTNRNPLIFIFVTRLIDAVGFGIIMPVLPQLLLNLGEPDVSAAGRVAGTCSSPIRCCSLRAGRSWEA